MTHTTTNLLQHEEAFLNSLLSYGIYSGRMWTLDMDLKSPFHTQESKIDMLVREAITRDNNLDSISLRQIYEAYLYEFNKEHFTAIDLDMPAYEEYKSQHYGYSTSFKTRTGYYETLDMLGAAGIFRTEKPDGTFKLHLAFRGTDTNVRPFIDYVKGAYLDMSAYYDAFKPLEKAFLTYAQDPANNISEVHISGHSLGGACVQEFFKSDAVQKSGLNMKGFTYGAPGATKKSWYNILPATYHMVKHKKFMQLGIAALESVAQVVLDMSPVKLKSYEAPITHYKHAGDLIPRAGSMSYKTRGENIHLNDKASSQYSDEFVLSGGKAEKELALLRAQEHIEKTGFFSELVTKASFYFLKNPPLVLSKAVSFQYHDMLRYITNLDYHMDNLLVKNPELLDSLSHFKSFNVYKEKFDKLSRGRFDLSLEETVAQLPNNLATIQNKVKSANQVLATVMAFRMASEASRDLGGQEIAVDYNLLKHAPRLKT